MSVVGQVISIDGGPGAKGSADRWVVGDDAVPDAAALRLFTFSHAGGGAAFFHPWRRALGPDVDVRSILLPGRESRIRELPYHRIEQLLDPVCAAMEPYLDLPFALFGHSMGAIVAYEAARRLAGRGRAPACLIVSGRRAPRLPSRRRLFCTLPDEEFVEAVKRLNGTPAQVLDQPELVNILLPALRADFELNEMYRPSSELGLSCPLLAYMGADDPEVDVGELAGWQAESSGDFTLRVFPGDHFYLLGGRRDVMSAVRADLMRAVAAGPM